MEFVFSGLPVGQHVALSAIINDELVIRKYTPVTSDDTRGHMDMIVKVSTPTVIA